MSKKLTECPSNLKEAIDWILRVTGKDGQSGVGGGGGDTAINDLTKQVQSLLSEVKGFGSGLGAGFEKVIGALDGSGSGTGLIAKLAEGLQHFIGYDGSSNGAPKITGAGIAPSNMATHRLCDATIAFTIGVLETLSKDSSIKDNSGYKQNVDSVISKLSECYGRGPGVFEGVAKEVEKLGEVKGQGKNHKDFDAIMGKVKEGFKSQLKNTNEGDIPNKVGTYLSAVFTAVKGTANVSTQLKQLVTKNSGVYDATQLSPQISQVKTQIQTGSQGFSKTVLTAGKNAFMARLEYKTKYISYYDNPQIAKWPYSDGEQKRCAKIFLGCLPLYYQALTYIYWGCHEKGGGWRNLTLAGGAMRSHFDSQGLLPLYVDRSKMGAHIAETALGGFSEFQAASSSFKDSNGSYATFTKKLLGLVKSEGSQNIHNSCPLSALFYGASCYFRYQQFENAKLAFNTPKTIREMLYFLGALQFSPQYDAFDSYVTSHFKTLTGSPSSDDFELKLQVADSGITPKPGSSSADTLSAADVKSYLASTFHLAPAFIGLIQDRSASHKSEPWLHSLFSNSQLNLSIPSSGAGIFGALSKYAYALQFQLHFLYQQCNNTYTKACGWNQCSYGSDINKSTASQIVESHICATGCTTHGSGNHTDLKDCQHANCGTQGKSSPLQAFLTDKLRGFSRQHPGSSYHLGSCSGAMCHVPIGFTAENLRAASNGNTQGENICLTLRPFCGGFNTPLRQLSEKLGCLTKRTPRTLGDLFGFVWHLNGQLFKSGSSADTALSEFFKSIGFNNYSGTSHTTSHEFFKAINEKIGSLKHPSSSKTIETALSVFPSLPFWYNLFMVDPGDSLPVRLFKVKSTDHNTGGTSKYQGNHNDLYSMYNQTCNESPNNSCGQYLYPLTHSDGATFAPTHASTYLSWMVYLTDDLQSQFQEMLEEFRNIDCSKSGCRGNTTGSKCGKNHANGTHGSNNDCSCPSVVHCGGTLPLLYRHGFRYYSPLELMGMSKRSSDNTKRDCKAFAEQLQSVVNGDPLSSLLTSIDTFLYAIRWEFFSKLSGFWTIYVCIILYTFFFLLDTLRVRSHLHFPSSNSIAPISLLGTGKAPALKKFAKLTYFFP
ncbi:variant erythrocyte surface antigen-1 family protein [Babesia caballi]|uniref:Variant erythrocyte surface antigen-1 family protein n=1 Tax=Babesia caballi TaxID=5871 RepID=A0AAV4LX12_BABCB|nr:variant erythrocyte surface antigen-1 family protein [Babesia caballi]